MAKTKKIGLLYGMENTFPMALFEALKTKGKSLHIIPENVLIDKLEQGQTPPYEVIIDRISSEVPFYQSYLKNASLQGSAVLNNPFWTATDEKFFNNSLAKKLDIPVPETFLIPSKQRPNTVSAQSFRNLKFPLDWEYMFEKVGFPAYIKPFDGGGWKNVYKVDSIEELWQKQEICSELVLLFQEAIDYTDYYRCFCIGGKYIHIMPYAPQNEFHLRYAPTAKKQGPAEKALFAKMEEYCQILNEHLGYDFNTVEFAIKDGIPYAIDFCNPVPDADLHSVGSQNFEWIVENTATFALEKAQKHSWGQNNCTWGKFLQSAVNNK